MSEKVAEIIAIGVTCIDHVSIVEHTPEGWEKCGAPLAQGGGLAATAAVAVARLGGEVELWAAVGDDYHGVMIKNELVKQGVCGDEVRMIKDVRTPSSFIEVDSETGERTIYFSPPRGMPAQESDYGFTPERAKKAKSLLITGMYPETSIAACKAVHENGGKVVADLAVITGVAEKLIPFVDALIMPEFADVLVEANGDFEKALKRMNALGPSMPVITVGAKGSYYLADGEVWRCPAFKIRAVDTTGCGDSFHGAFTYTLARGMNIHESVRFCSAVSALKATKLGGRTGLPTMPELQAFLKERDSEGRAMKVA